MCHDIQVICQSTGSFFPCVDPGIKLNIQLSGRSLFPLTDLTAPTSMSPHSLKDESCSLGWPQILGASASAYEYRIPGMYHHAQLWFVCL